MARLEDLTKGAQVNGIRPEGPVEVLDAKWHGTNTLELTYRGLDGKPGNELLFRDREATLEVATKGPSWSFDADDLVIARLDKLSRDEDVQAKLEACRDWDLVIVDEAHKMSASFFSREVRETERYKLGKVLGRLNRHLLLSQAGAAGLGQHDLLGGKEGA